MSNSIIYLSVMENMTSLVERNTDRISDLPDDIILKYFINPLNFKEKAQISTLSRRWRDLFTHCTELDFDKSVMSLYDVGPHQLKFLDSVDRVLSKHCALHIVKFYVRVCVYGIEDAPSRLDKWVKFAISKSVQDLKLNTVTSREYTLRLDVLKHSRYCGDKNGISSLRSLNLTNVDVSGEVIEFILSSCHLLECLHVQGSLDLLSLKVKSTKLKHLALINAKNLKELEIEAKSLSYFDYSDKYTITPPNIVFKSAPLLSEAAFGGMCCTPPFTVFRQIASVAMQFSKLSLDLDVMDRYYDGDCDIPVQILPSFCNVKHLEIKASYNGHLVFRVMDMIGAFPNMRRLNLTLISVREEILAEGFQLQEDESEEESDGEESETELELMGPSETEVLYQEQKTNQNLRELEVKGFMGCFIDVGIIMHVVDIAINLQTIKCQLYVPWRENSSHILEALSSRAGKLTKILASRVEVVWL